MSTDERPDSLAAQAASWVPPWERPQPPPDRDYQAAVTSPDIADDQPEDPSAEAPEPEPDEDRSVTGQSDEDDDDVDGAGPAGAGELPPELPPLPGESGGTETVDAPTEVPGEVSAEPTDVGDEPEVPVPAPIEAAVADAEDDELGYAVDAPLPPDGDDAGDVFDAAADDDVSDEAEIDFPPVEDVPGEGDDETKGSDTDLESGAGLESGAERLTGDGGELGAGGAGALAFAAGQADAEAALGFGGGATGRAEPRSAVPAQGRKTDRPGAAGGAEEGRTEDGFGEVGSGGEEPAAAGDGLAGLDDAELRAALEAILLVVDEPVAEMQLAQIVEQPTERVAAMLEDISARYTAAGHGFDLRRAAGGWRLYTRPEYAPYVERFVLDGQSVRLTQAALETLAVVAYKQPVTRSRISAIRGVNCDGVMRTLVTRGLIEECGIEGETGAYLYRTTPLFLEKLGLNSVDQLPPLAPFLPDDVEEVLDASG